MRLLVTTQAVDQDHPILGFFVGWLKEFARHFDEVHVICLQEGDYELPDNVHVYSLGKETGENRLKYVWRFYRHFWHIFVRVRVDYVFFHMGAIYNLMAAPFFWVRHFYGTRFYWWKAHGHINRLGRDALWFVDEVVTSTASGFPIETPKRRIIGQAIDPGRFTLPTKEDRRGLIYVGRIMPVKHLDVFLETYLRLRDAGIDLEPKIIGPLTDKTYVAKLKAYCTEHGIDPAIFVGPRSQKELVVIYQQADIFLNPSTTHSMDKTVVEAVFCGCLPVTSNRAFKELLQPDALYLESATASDYVSAIKNLLVRTDRQDLRHRLAGTALRQHSLHTFTKRVFNLT